MNEQRYNGVCQICGGPADRGWSTGQRHPVCIPCDVARVLGPVRTHASHIGTRRIVECACGCGRVGALAARGYVEICYRRWLHATRRR